MEFLEEWWGVNDKISVSEIAARCLVMFLITIIIIRIAGMRSFRKNNPFDMVIAFLIGGVLSRGVVGATPFIPAVIGGFTLIILHKIFARLSFISEKFENVAKGEKVLIYKNGKFIKENMKKADVTSLEVFEDLRVEFQTESLEQFSEIYVEKTGEISFVKK